jgi:hypothetical protein
MRDTRASFLRRCQKLHSHARVPAPAKFVISRSQRKFRGAIVTLGVAYYFLR